MWIETVDQRSRHQHTARRFAIVCGMLDGLAQRFDLGLFQFFREGKEELMQVGRCICGGWLVGRMVMAGVYVDAVITTTDIAIHIAAAQTFATT